VSQAEFALGADLEEFIDKNWNRINLNRKLKKKLKRYTSDALARTIKRCS